MLLGKYIYLYILHFYAETNTFFLTLDNTRLLPPKILTVVQLTEFDANCKCRRRNQRSDQHFLRPLLCQLLLDQHSLRPLLCQRMFPALRNQPYPVVQRRLYQLIFRQLQYQHLNLQLEYQLLVRPILQQLMFPPRQSQLPRGIKKHLVLPKRKLNAIAHVRRPSHPNLQEGNLQKRRYVETMVLLASKLHSHTLMPNLHHISYYHLSYLHSSSLFDIGKAREKKCKGCFEKKMQMPLLVETIGMFCLSQKSTFGYIAFNLLNPLSDTIAINTPILLFT